MIVSFTRSASRRRGRVRAGAPCRRRRSPAAWTSCPCSSRAPSSSGPPRSWTTSSPLRPVRTRLRANGGRMEVMVGYSDSAKEAGVLAASLALYEAQRRIAAWGWERGIDVTIFHGRGGALGRGGRPDRARDRGAAAGLGGRPVQGDRAGRGRVRPLRRPRRRVAPPRAARPRRRRRAGLGGGRPRRLVRERDRRLLRTASEAAWRALVTTPGFARCFTEATPIRQIASLPIASRPVSRTATVEDLDALRAIPWVFAWAQARVNLPGWFGLGSGLEAVAATRGGLARLRRLHRAWPFFAVIVENAELSLAKADRGARRALPRAGGPARHHRDDRARSGTGPSGCCSRSPATSACWTDGRGSATRSPCARRTSTPSLTCSSAPRRSGGDARLVQTTIGGLAAGLQNTG